MVVGGAIGTAALLGVAMTSPINIGSRHVLVVYPLVALPAAYGWARWAEQVRQRRVVLWCGAALVSAQIALLVMSVPYQSAYFNVLGGREPAWISSDSDFDWGQDGLAAQVDPCRLRFPPLKALPAAPVSGWMAVSERIYRLNRGGRADPCATVPSPLNAPPGWLDWLKARRPDAIVGRTIRLYYVAADELPSRLSVTGDGPR